MTDLAERIRQSFDSVPAVTIEDVRRREVARPEPRHSPRVRVALAVSFSAAVALVTTIIVVSRPTSSTVTPPAGTSSPTTLPITPTTLPPSGTVVSRTLHVVVRPGSERTVSYQVPPAHTLSLTRFVLRSPHTTVGSGSIDQSGRVRFEQLSARRSMPLTLVEVSMSELAAAPLVTATLNWPIAFGAGERVALSVSCAGHKPCNVQLTFTGVLMRGNKPAPGSSPQPGISDTTIPQPAGQQT
jgi:hypothetical protein